MRDAACSCSLSLRERAGVREAARTAPDIRHISPAQVKSGASPFPHPNPLPEGEGAGAHPA
jgi:hypothetical protein